MKKGLKKAVSELGDKSDYITFDNSNTDNIAGFIEECKKRMGTFILLC